MTGLIEEQAPVLLTDHAGSKRQLRYEVEAISVSRDWVSVNTLAANAFAQRALELGLVAELKGYASIRREVAPSKRSRSRFDLLLEGTDGRCFVEVKSVTLKHHGQALFPDAVTERGRKHLDALGRLATKGERAAMLYVNKRSGCDVFRAASGIDPRYASALRRAAKAGVEILCVGCTVDERGLSFGGRVPVELA
jgi:sugar fermentation stimulation protein A